MSFSETNILQERTDSRKRVRTSLPQVGDKDPSDTSYSRYRRPVSLPALDQLGVGHLQQSEKDLAKRQVSRIAQALPWLRSREARAGVLLL